MAHITIPSNSISIREYIQPHITVLSDLLPNEIYKYTKVFISGAWFGVTSDPVQLYNMLKDQKSRGIINIYTSIIFDYKVNELRVCNDSGRLTRPLLKVKNNNLLITNEHIDKIKSKIS